LIEECNVIKNGNGPSARRLKHRSLLGLALVLCTFVVILWGINSTHTLSAHAASLSRVGTHTGWVLLYNGKSISPQYHRQASSLYGNGTIPCLTVTVTLANPNQHEIKAALAIQDNNCSGSVKVTWAIGTTIFCGPGQFPGPGGNSGSTSVIVVKNAAPVEPFLEEGTVTCLHDGIPQPWTATSNGSAVGPILGTTQTASGSDVKSIAGF
jgi:hypothetical protein